MKLGVAIAEILKREGVEIICGYPLNFLFEYAAAADIRPVISRAERVGGHMADAISRVTSGQTIGVYATQNGPGIENGMGAVAQAYGESVPLLVMPMAYARDQAHVAPNFNATTTLRSVAKLVEPIVSARQVPDLMRRAFAQLRNGRGGPVVVEIPIDVWDEDVPEPLDCTPVPVARYGPAPADVARAVDLLLAAERPMLFVGQGVHYAQAWPQLRTLAERLALPVATSVQGKSAFPEDHPLALGAGGAAMPKTVHHWLSTSDPSFGIGCSFTRSGFAVTIPDGPKIIHATLDPAHLCKDIPTDVGLLGDAGLTIDAVLAELDARGVPQRDPAPVAAEIAQVRREWLAEWMPKLTSDQNPMTPYRVIHELMQVADVANTIITHDAGSPRDQLSPFWVCTEPLTYLGWGKTTQLGYGLGLAMGAKLARPDKLCVNLWGDAAIGFTGMDFETCVRERIPILSILFNNHSMAMELPMMPVSTAKYRSTDIGGDYAAMARAFGGHGERITDPADIADALRRGIAKTQEGVPVLLEFMTCQELAISRYGDRYIAPVAES